ncbi:protein phosphatase 1 regulatory subunit 37 [Polyodon spathula]|uniref:protein phosphatase 1 regulatory subunit 37 n=1 Tax=Polyodon spathula TaxID=7913 RepID=UPI001B7EFF82|nr:protein phosphatase 1 regulatory subunit 37 [Polyodon spathula]XP_041092229.1 protein phosphatase 1 regulatory subunit 37 [Polyodon spathula]
MNREEHHTVTELSNAKEKTLVKLADRAGICPLNSQQVMASEMVKFHIGADDGSVGEMGFCELERVAESAPLQELGESGEVNGGTKTEAPHITDSSADQDHKPHDQRNSLEDAESAERVVDSGLDHVGNDAAACVDLTLQTSVTSLEVSPEQGDRLQTVQESAPIPASGCSVVLGAPAPNTDVKEATLNQGGGPVSPPPPPELLKPGGKRVTFPCDEDIISGAVEPKDPWRHAQNVTVDEIIAAYKLACQKVNCKPIQKLLKQIQEIKDLTQRTECLDLKGEKLDYRACDALEEIFKRVQFKLVDLEQTNLDEDGASALFDMIEYYESATHLNISFNKHIGTRGWQAAAHMMKKTNCLQYLDARHTPLLDHSAPFVARALRISSSLGVLHLENAGLSGRPLMLLATALKMNVNLRELYLADNKLNGLQDSAQLGNLLKFNCYIQILDLRNNHVLDSGLAYLCEGLKEQRKGLVTLVLWNNQLTHNGMVYLAAALPCTQSLETVNLGHNSIGNEGVHKLKDGLIANRSVLRLGLASTKLSCEGAVAVAEFIAESPRLLRLDLRENEIKTGGLMALSLALKVNTSLLRLDLDRDPKREAVKSFLETQRALLSEIQNGCKHNFILAKEKEETEQKMHQSASMPEITMALPQTEEGVAAEGSGQGEVGGGKPPSHKQEEENEAGAATSNNLEQESDSDTDDEVEGSAQAPVSVEKTTTPPPPPPPCHPVPTAAVLVEPPSGSGDAAPSFRLEDKPGPVITLCDPAATLCSPTQSNEKRISVTSPGRGHKVFVVTRVESPPEQPLQAVGKAQTTPLLSQPTTLIPVKGGQASLALQASPLKSTVSESPAPAVADGPLLHLPSKAEVKEGVQCAAAAGGTFPNGLKAEFIRILPKSCETPEPKGVGCPAEDELCCWEGEKKLEELLLEASLETGREAL